MRNSSLNNSTYFIQETSTWCDYKNYEFWSFFTQLTYPGDNYFWNSVSSGKHSGSML